MKDYNLAIDWDLKMDFSKTAYDVYFLDILLIKIYEFIKENSKTFLFDIISSK